MNDLVYLAVCIVSLVVAPLCAGLPPDRDSEVYVELITAMTQAELDHAISLIESNHDFREVARSCSTHSTAQDGGIWGPLRLDELPVELRREIPGVGDRALVKFFNPRLGFVALRRIDASAAKKSLLEIVLNRGAAYLQKNENKQALMELRRAVAIDPRSGAAHQLLGQAHLAQGSYEEISEAKSEFVQALDLDPSLIWARFYLARIYLDWGNPDRAKEELELGLRSRPKVPHLLSLLGEANRKLGNPRLAAEQNRSALDADPSFFVAHYYLGLAYLDLGKEDDAVRELEIAAKSEAPIAEIYLSLGAVYLQKGDVDGALELYQKAVAVAPGRLEAHLRLGQAYRAKGMTRPALQELALAFPDGARVLNTLYYQQLQADTFFEQGMIYQQMEDQSRAIEAYSKVLDLDPSRGNAHRQLAEALFLQKQYEAALGHALKADELKTPVAPALLEQITRRAKNARANIP